MVDDKNERIGSYLSGEVIVKDIGVKVIFGGIFAKYA
jgi:hypothetical protein